MSTKIDRAIHGPGWGEVILGVILSLGLGVALGAFVLIIKPTETVRAMPKEPAANVIYYLEGSRDSSRGREAAAKRQAFVAGQSVTLNEAELNVLAVAAAARAPAAAAAPGGEKAGADEGWLKTEALNFRINEGALQVGVPATVSLFGISQKFIVQARGAFVRTGEGFSYEPDTFLVGSCPIQRLPLVAGIAKKMFFGRTIPEDIATAWPKLAEVSIEGDALKLAMP